MTDTGQPESRKQYTRKDWAGCTRFDRQFLRAEYRHLVRTGTSRIIARGCINRMADMLAMSRRGF